MVFKILLSAVIVQGVIVFQIFGGTAECEPELKTEYSRGTIKNLSEQEIERLLLKRATRRWLIKRMLWYTAAAGLIWFFVKSLVPDSGVFLAAGWACVKGFSVMDTPDELKVMYPDGTELILDKGGAYWKQLRDVEMVRLLLLTDEDGGKVFTQAQVGKLFGISRQMTNRRIMLLKSTKDLHPLVKCEYEKSVLTDKVLKRIAEIAADDWYAGDEYIAEKLIEEGTCSKISSGAVNRALTMMDARYLRKSIRKKISRGDMNVNMGHGYLVKRLFELLEKLTERDGNQEYIDLKSLAEKMEGKSFERRGKYKRDGNQERLSTEQNRGRKENVLNKALEQGWDIYKERTTVCPDCLSGEVKLKQKRCRSIKRRSCNVENTNTLQYECKNDSCSTKTFTVLANEIEPWARSDFFLKRKAIDLIFGVRGSFRRASEHISFDTGGKGPCAATIINWIRKAGREAVPFERLFPIRTTGVLGIDEKWVKCFKEWVYIYKVFDIKTGYPVLMRVFPSCNKENARAVLLEVKTLGYNPKVIVTDLITSYDKAVKELFKDTLHQKCLFHAEKDARKVIREYINDGGSKKEAEKLYPLLRGIFSAVRPAAAEAQIKRFLWARDFFDAKAEKVFNLIHRVRQDIINPKKDPQIPATNNRCESAIKEFDLLYSTTYGYCSLAALQEFLQAYTVYVRFKKYDTGPFKGMSPVEIAGYDTGNLTWDFYLLAA